MNARLVTLLIAICVCVIVPNIAPSIVLGQPTNPDRKDSPSGQSELEQIRELSELANKLFQEARFADCLMVHIKILSVKERLYPKEKYPNGHVHIVVTLQQIGRCYNGLKDAVRERDFVERALAMCRKV